ncbi:hypothetical protein CHLNCDRAFT_143546 [Chlorella variabilis]|uniref:Large ribosomal subunit protein uL15/eL18 domain-containing protein n=1 Tax=Chlorella variabilis TaxID=554065 RepID=E1ZB53_CHLVA|nr:hypothetical protein CHLNCDRAFT_143546 [Chlorella variabilis]EFN56964.1 hypothetical protein CHLNCDRAFT_143546 [Chlorella variabilis]|eukprot:XP_005849066.1 hypothetical protein CHLNCDRAFT_143546 [Chlorella variabilis]
MQALTLAQVKPALAGSFFSGKQLQQRSLVAKAARPSIAVVSSAVAEEAERLRLNNLSPQDGARKSKNRKGRGYGAGQGGTAGFGMRGQKSRSGSGIRPGFEGGQTPLYRRLPKLKGIAGGMGAGLPDFVVVNLAQLDKFAEGEEVTLESLEEKRIVNLSGRESRLPLKVLGTGELTQKLVIKAAAFSESAKQKIEAAGGQAVELPQKVTWTRKAHEARVAAAQK